MTQRELIDSIISEANAISTLRDKGLHENTVLAHASKAYNQILGDLIAKGYRNLSLFTKLCVGDGTGIDVQLNDDTGIYYSIIPYDVSPLTDIRSGVRVVGPMNNVSVEFPPLLREQIGIRSNTLASKVSNIIYNAIGIDNYGNITVDYIGMTFDNAIDKVRMYLLLPLESYDEDDTIHIPAGQDKVFIDMVISMLQGKNIKDMVNIYKNGQ